MRISDWSSDVCSSDLAEPLVFKISQDSAPDHVRSIQIRRFAKLLQERAGDKLKVEYYEAGQLMPDRDVPKALRQGSIQMEIGRASCRERVWQYVEISVGAV